MTFLLPAKNLFCADIENAGIEIDSYNLYNFGLDTEGNCWYLDTCAPWYKYRQEPIRLLFDEDLLRGKIGFTPESNATLWARSAQDDTLDSYE